MTIRQMRNVRTGKIAVYDQSLIESGRWEALDEAPSAKEKPAADDEVAVKDEIKITLTKAKDEGKQRKA